MAFFSFSFFFSLRNVFNNGMKPLWTPPSLTLPIVSFSPLFAIEIILQICRIIKSLIIHTRH